MYNKNIGTSTTPKTMRGVKLKMKIVKLKIDGQNDRRQLASILADNGYKVFIEVK